MLLLFVALQAVSLPPDALPRGTWARISRSVALRRDAVSVDFRTSYDKAARRQDYILRRTLTRGAGEPVTSWASSRTCAAMSDVVSFADLPMPKPQTPSDAAVIVLDGVGYHVTVPVSYSDDMGSATTLRSNGGTPLAKWVDGALAKLEGCWSTEAPPEAS
jgi:hypothetical protein